MSTYLKLLGILFVSSLFAAQTPFPNHVVVDGKKLELNGVGTRKATWFKVKVYDAALYLEKKSTDAAEILSDAGLKQVDLKFLRSVEGKDIAEAWDGSFKRSCEAKCDVLVPYLKALKTAMVDLKEGDVQTYRFNSGGVSYLFNGKSVVDIQSSDFGRVLLSMWIGKNPPNEELRDGLVGKRTD